MGIDLGTSPHIPLCRPLLPQASALEKYLRQIDANRWYTNHGPLVGEFEERITSHFGVSRSLVISANSGSSALIGAILASAGYAMAEKPYCFCPSFSFIATASSSIRCGFTPYFVDIDQRTWGIEPNRLLGHPQIEHAGLVIPVAPFGRHIDLRGWADFHKQTGIPVVVDAAACFDTLWQSNDEMLPGIIVAMSLHATKVFSTAEGGLIFCADETILRKCYAALNHGFSGARISNGDSINGKLSEYHAAIGLASLDQWSHRKSNMEKLAKKYEELSAELGIRSQLIVAGSISAVYALFTGDSAASSNRVEAALSERNIGSLRWYGHGLHNEPAFAACPHDDLPVTEDICSRTLGVPFFIDMTDQQVSDVLRAVASAR